MKHISAIILIVLLGNITIAQQNRGNWSYHLSNIKTFDVVEADRKVYFVSDGGIYFYNKDDNSINTFTKIDGLSSSEFKGIEYSPSTGSLVVYYHNSMVDVIMPSGKVYPISDINRKSIVGDKMIYSAKCHKNYCYLACGFGIVVLDLSRMEVSDSFIVGDSGDYLTVYDVALDETNIYAATANGLKYASLDAPNLLDYNYWGYIENDFVVKQNYNKVNYANGYLWLVHNSSENFSDHLLVRDTEGNWSAEYESLVQINSLRFHDDFIVYTGIGSSRSPNITSNTRESGVHRRITEYPFMQEGMGIDPRAAIIDSNGEMWIADMNYGGIRYRTGGNFERLTPRGPIDNSAFALSYSDNKLWVAGGGYNASWNNIFKGALFQGYSSGRWEHINRHTHTELKEHYDVVQVVARPGSPNHVFAATWGGGILEFRNGKLENIFDDRNSSLQNIIPGSYYTRVGGIAFDSAGNMWATTSEVAKVLHRRSPDGNWTGFVLPEIANNYKVGKPLVASNGDIWIIVPREATYGLYVMSPDGRQKKHLSVTSYFRNNEGPIFSNMNNVFDLVEDLDGKMWVGTSRGVAVFSYPDRVFTDEDYYASRPGVDRKDGLYHPLLQFETVTALAVDGGNRKYCGTRSSGIYLVSPDGTQEIAHYTTENSPLISNNILSLEYDGDNGFLYVATDKGLVSLHTESRRAFERFTDVYAYPNPVRSGYTGDIYITGMMEDTNVKITTISGRLVYETTSIGGQAVWDGRDLSGRQVHTGIYLVFLAANEGQESAVTKIAFIR